MVLSVEKDVSVGREPARVHTVVGRESGSMSRGPEPEYSRVVEVSSRGEMVRSGEKVVGVVGWVLVRSTRPPDGPDSEPRRRNRGRHRPPYERGSPGRQSAGGNQR